MKTLIGQFKSQHRLVLFIVILFSAILRVVNLYSNLHFTGDEGRDALVAYGIITGENYPILGPGSSIGDINLGPLYYYLIAPFSLLGQNPVYLALPVIIFSVATSILLYFFCKLVFKDRLLGFVAAVIYAVSPGAVEYGRWSWNPNIMPFFSLLFTIAIWQILFSRKPKWLLVMALSFSVMIQSHYVALVVLLPVFYLLYRERKAISIKKYSLWFGLSVLLGAVFLSPLVIYDVSRGFRNVKGFIGLFSSGGGNLTQVPVQFLFSMGEVYSSFFGILVIFGLIISLFCLLFAYKNMKRREFMFVTTWLLGSILGISFVGYELKTHYYEFLGPVISVFIATALLSAVRKKQIISGIFAITLFCFMAARTISIVTIAQEPTLSGIKTLVSFIEEDSKGSPFNFAVLSDINREDSYLFFFTLDDTAVETARSTDQLYVICEGDAVCNPHGHPKYEIAVFDVAYNGQVEISETWYFGDYYKLLKITPKLTNNAE